MSDVLAIVVAHDSGAVLAKCLDALGARAGSVSVSIVVIDSGSSDHPERVCRDRGVPVVRVANRGLAAAFNRGLEQLAERRARYVLQLNPDVELLPGSLENLVAHADDHPRCGIVAPAQIDRAGRPIFSMGFEPSLGRFWRGLSDPGRDWDREPEHYRGPRDAEWLMGACLLLRAEMLETIGGFDERFFLCSEEVDLCRRARQAGWSVRHLPAARVVHALAEQVSDHRLRLEEWSLILYLRKWQARPARTLSRLAHLLWLLRGATRKWRDGVPWRDQRVRLAAAVRFRADAYGPAPRP